MRRARLCIIARRLRHVLEHLHAGDDIEAPGLPLRELRRARDAVVDGERSRSGVQRATSIMPGARSIAVTVAPACASASASSPPPQPTSRTRAAGEHGTLADEARAQRIEQVQRAKFPLADPRTVRQRVELGKLRGVGIGARRPRLGAAAAGTLMRRPPSSGAAPSAPAASASSSLSKASRRPALTAARPPVQTSLTSRARGAKEDRILDARAGAAGRDSEDRCR